MQNRTAARLIQTRYPGHCAYCGGTIRRGDTISWARGEGVWHPACEHDPAAAIQRAEIAMERDQEELLYGPSDTLDYA